MIDLLKWIVQWFKNFTGTFSLFGAILKLIGMVFFLLIGFVYANMEQLTDYIDKMPDFMKSGMRLVAGYLRSFNDNLSGFIDPLRDEIEFFNTVLPLNELVAGLIALTGLALYCFILRAMFKFTVIFR